METKYSTGQAILIPATIRAAREENGVIIYEVDTNHWDGIPEDAIVIDDNASARKAFNKELENMARDMFPRY